MIEISEHVQTLTALGRPTLLTCARAVLPCRCAIYIGILAEDGEKASAAIACTDHHEHLMRHTTMLLMSSLVEPSDRRLVDVVDELLEQAARHHGIPVA